MGSFLLFSANHTANFGVIQKSTSELAITLSLYS